MEDAMNCLNGWTPVFPWDAGYVAPPKGALDLDRILRAAELSRPSREERSAMREARRWREIPKAEADRASLDARRKLVSDAILGEDLAAKFFWTNYYGKSDSGAEDFGRALRWWERMPRYRMPPQGGGWIEVSGLGVE